MSDICVDHHFTMLTLTTAMTTVTTHSPSLLFQRGARSPLRCTSGLAIACAIALTLSAAAGRSATVKIEAKDHLVPRGQDTELWLQGADENAKAHWFSFTHLSGPIVVPPGALSNPRSEGKASSHLFAHALDSSTCFFAVVRTGLRSDTSDFVVIEVCPALDSASRAHIATQGGPLLPAASDSTTLCACGRWDGSLLVASAHAPGDVRWDSLAQNQVWKPLKNPSNLSLTAPAGCIKTGAHYAFRATTSTHCDSAADTLRLVVYPLIGDAEIHLQGAKYNGPSHTEFQDTRGLDVQCGESAIIHVGAGLSDSVEIIGWDSSSTLSEDEPPVNWTAIRYPSMKGRAKSPELYTQTLRNEFAGNRYIWYRAIIKSNACQEARSATFTVTVFPSVKCTAAVRPKDPPRRIR